MSKADDKSQYEAPLGKPTGGEASQGAEYAGPFLLAPDGSESSGLEFDIKMPSGTCWIYNDGTSISREKAREMMLALASLKVLFSNSGDVKDPLLVSAIEIVDKALD